MGLLSKIFSNTRKPEGFLEGMNAVMLAPTAVNQQKLKFIIG